MRSVVRMLILGLAVVLGGQGLSVAGAAPRAAAGAAPGRRDYVRVTQWAASHGLKLRWVKRDESIQLSNDSSLIMLKADSREGQINGIDIWLSFPVVASGGNLLVSQLDCQTVLEPLLFPPRNSPYNKIAMICLDPGHGGRDPGNEVGTYQEKRYTLLLAQELREQLARAGFKVFLTRSRDSFVELWPRPELARRKKADLFICLHFNSAESSRNSVRGLETYCLTPAGAGSTNAQGESGGDWCLGNRQNGQNISLAYQVQKSLTQRLGLEDRGVRRARFAVLREATMPAVLIEGGFMSHPAEGRKIFSPEYRRQLAGAIVEAVTAYKRTVERGA